MNQNFRASAGGMGLCCVNCLNQDGRDLRMIRIGVHAIIGCVLLLSKLSFDLKTRCTEIYQQTPLDFIGFEIFNTHCEPSSRIQLLYPVNPSILTILIQS